MLRARYDTTFRLAHRTALAWILAMAFPPAHAKPPRTDIYGDPLPECARVRMGTIQLRHANPYVAISADGQTLISCSLDGVVRHWNIASGRLLHKKRFIGAGKDTKGFSRMALSGNGALAAARIKDKIHLFDTDSGRERGCFSISACIRASLQFSADGKRLVVNDEDKGSLQVWDVTASKKIRTLSTEAECNVMAVSPHGDILALGGPNHKQSLWRVSTDKPLRDIEGVGSGMTFAPDGKTFAAIGRDESTVRLWETDSGKEKTTFPVSDDLKFHLVDLAFSPDGARLAGVGQPSLIVWDVATRKILRRFPERGGTALAFTPDGRTLVCWGAGNEIRLWDLATGKQLHARPGHADAVAAIAVSPDGKLAASGAVNDPHLYLWDTATGRLLRRLKGRDGEVKCCTFSPDGKQILTCGESGTLQLWDIAGGKELRRLKVPEPKGDARPWFRNAAFGFTADGKGLRMVRTALDIGRRHAEGQVLIWDTESSKLVSHRPYKVDYQQRALGGGVTAMWIEMHAAFAPGGERVTVRDGKRLIIENTGSGRTLAVLPEKTGRPVRFSPDGQLLAAGILQPVNASLKAYSMSGISLIEAATGQEILRIKSGEKHFFDFSGDGRWLAAVDEKALRLWDLATGADRFRRSWSEEISPHAEEMPDPPVAFLPRGKGVITGMKDGTLLVWDLPSRMRSGDETQRRGSGKELESLWSDLIGDARKAHRAVCTLSAIPSQALPFLNDRVRPIEPIDAKLLAKQLADLDSDEFAVRQQAAHTLTQWGDKVHPALRRYLRQKPSLEARRRIEQILTAARPTPSAGTLRTLRAIRVLERIGTAEARQTLRRLAAGAEGASLTRAAQAALARLTLQPISIPPQGR